MNAALLMLSLSAGGHPAPGCCGAAPAATAPCDGCGDAKPKLLDKLKGRLGRGAKADGCGCDPCGGPTNLLDKLKGRRAKHHHAPAADCGGCDPCATAPAAAPAAPAAEAPKDMPKPDTKPAVPKELPKTGGNPGALIIPTPPVTPVSSPKLNGANSPY